LPEIAGFKLLTTSAAMDFLVKTDNKGSRRYGTFSIDFLESFNYLQHFVMEKGFRDRGKEID
jgi:hypothetical protein